MAVDSRSPTSDEGELGTWSGAGGFRYNTVNDFPDTTSYLQHGTAAGYLTFGFLAFAIPAGSTGIQVSVVYYDAEPSNGNNNSNARIKVGGTYYDNTAHNPVTGTPTLRSKLWATNPKTGAAWTVDDVNGVGTNALQAFGFSSTDANPVYNVYSVKIDVTYTPPVSSQTLSPSGIASAEAFGTAKFTTQLSPSGIASAQAFGTARFTTQLLPSGVASAQAFGTATVGSNTQTLSPGGSGSAQAFGTAKLTAQLSPGGMTSAQAFGTAKMTLSISLNIGTRVG